MNKTKLKYLGQMSCEERLDFFKSVLCCAGGKILSANERIKNGLEGWDVKYYTSPTCKDSKIFVSDFIALSKDKFETEYYTLSLRSKMKQKFDKDYKRDLVVIERIERKEIEIRERLKKEAAKCKNKIYSTMVKFSSK